MPKEIIQPGLKIKHLRFVNLISDKGAQGPVWHAIDESMNRPVAVKLFVWQTDNQEHDKTKKRWDTEAQLWSGLHSHPNIITLYHYDPSVLHESDEGSYFLKLFEMELAHHSLEQELAEKSHKLSLLLRWMTQIVSGLDAAHARDVVHRDIKPGNVLLVDVHGEGLVAKLSDFGIARHGEGVESNLFYGTPPYAAPEQHAGKSTKRSDIYGLGMTFLHMLLGRKFRNVLRSDHGLTGKHFVRNSIKQVKSALEENELTRCLLDLIERMLSPDREELPAIADTLNSLLTATVQSERDNTYTQTTHSESPTEIWHELQNRFVWRPEVHAAYRECLLYFWIRGFFSVTDLRISLGEFLEPITRNSFCCYEVYGSEDIVLRIWTNEELKNAITKKIIRIAEMIHGSVDYFEVETASYLWAEDKLRTPVTDIAQRLEDLALSHDPVGGIAQSPLILGEIPENVRSHLKAFTRITAYKIPLSQKRYEKMVQIIRESLHDATRTPAGDEDGRIGRVSVYFGKLTQRAGSNGLALPCVLVKFNARDFYHVESIPYLIHAQDDLRPLGMRTDTYLVTRLNMQESDDGPFLIELERTARSKSQK